LQQARSEAEQANIAKDEFLNLVSHELRNPINTILLLSESLHRSSPDQKVVRLAQWNQRAASNLTRMVDDLLDSARIATGKLSIERHRFNFMEAVRGATDTMAPAAEAESITFTVKSDAETIPIQGDRDRLQQVMCNLLGNAIKFTRAGGQVEMSIIQGDEGIELRVIDTGVGIAPEFLPHVFDRFAQANPNPQRKGGLGLGLALAKYIVEAHGGTIRAFSQGQGQGATFTLILPRGSEINSAATPAAEETSSG
jgi:signal transduction histidine kinase